MRTEKPELLRHYGEVLVRILRDTQTELGEQYTEKELSHDIRYIRSRVNSPGGQRFITVELSRLGKAFDKCLSTDQPYTVPDGFKSEKYGNVLLPKFMRALHAGCLSGGGVVFPVTTTHCFRNGQLEDICTFCCTRCDCFAWTQYVCVRAIRQICYLGYKLEYPYDPKLVDERIANFVGIEDALPEEEESVSLSAETYRVLSDANALLSRIFMGLNPEDITPKHGPGAVATGERREEKYTFTRLHQKLEEYYHYCDYFFFSYTHMSDHLDRLDKLVETDASTAKVQLVPKDSRGPRIISMEPLELQWIQQGLRRAMVRSIESSPLVSNRVNFSDQGVNRALAQLASQPWDEASKFVTLDMRDASDRVSTWLVKQVFPPELYKALKACRSEYTLLPDGRRIKLKKFAPMGSAVCFPVESMIFWALAVSTALPRKWAWRDVQDVFVYGDDLILQKENVARLSTVYEELHLEFNVDKCCTGRFFRESCGGDYFKGRSVTPVRLHTRWPERFSAKSPATLLSYVSYANRLGDMDNHGFPTAKQYVVSVMEQQFGALPRIPESQSNYALGIKCDWKEKQRRAYMSRFKSRYNKRLQRLEWKVPAVHPCVIERMPCEDWDWMWSIVSQPPGSLVDPFGFVDRTDLGQFTVPDSVKFGWTWTAGDQLSIYPC